MEYRWVLPACSWVFLLTLFLLGYQDRECWSLRCHILPSNLSTTVTMKKQVFRLLKTASWYYIMTSILASTLFNVN